MSSLIKTPFKNLYYNITSKGLKSYVAMFYKDKKRHKKTLGVIRLTRAKKELKLFKLDIENQLTDLKFSDVFKEYIDLASSLQSEKEIKTKISIYNNHFVSLYNKNIEFIKYSDCQDIINNALCKGLKPKTAKNIKAVLQVVFTYAIKQQYTDNNPASIVDIPKFDNKQYLKISKIQAKELYKNILLCENDVIRDIMIFGFHGRRLGECLNITWGQVSIKEKYYTLPAQKNKSKKHLEFSMNDTLYFMFKNRFKIALENNTYKQTDYCFINPDTHTKYSTITRSFKRVKINSDIPIKDFRFHDFRHLFGTYSINELNKTIEEVSHALGHSDIVVTQMYLSRDKDTAKRVCGDYMEFIND